MALYYGTAQAIQEKGYEKGLDGWGGVTLSGVQTGVREWIGGWESLLGL